MIGKASVSAVPLISKEDNGGSTCRSRLVSVARRVRGLAGSITWGFGKLGDLMYEHCWKGHDRVVSRSGCGGGDYNVTHSNLFYLLFWDIPNGIGKSVEYMNEKLGCCSGPYISGS